MQRPDFCLSLCTPRGYLHECKGREKTIEAEREKETNKKKLPGAAVGCSDYTCLHFGIVGLLLKLLLSPRR